jgi:hypothetical protein
MLMITFRKSLRFLSTLALLVTLAASATAQITFTYTATADYSAAGYVSATSYTFVFKTASAFPSTAGSSFVSSGSTWTTDNYPAQPNPWVEVSGTGLTGTFAIPSGTDAYAGVKVSSDFDGYLKAIAANYNGTTPIGLQTPDLSDIVWIEATGFGGNLPTWTLSQSYEEPFDATTGYFAANSYFGAYTGPWSMGYDSKVYLYDSAFNYLAEFTVTSISISATSAIPEPSTYAGLAGLVALGLVVGRRCQQKA